MCRFSFCGDSYDRYLNTEVRTVKIKNKKFNLKQRTTVNIEVTQQVKSIVEGERGERERDGCGVVAMEDRGEKGR